MLDVKDLVVRFGKFTAVDGVSLSLPEGPHGLGLIGESGSGKTTVGRALLRLVKASSGSITFEGADVLAMRKLRPYRRAVQVVLQDPDGALNPRMRIGDAIAEVLRTHKLAERSEERAAVTRLLTDVDLTPDIAERFPHEVSGGQRQRVSIARALAVQPRVLILDEPTSALDVTVQARILELFDRLRDRHQLSYLLISHDLAVVDQLCEHTMVMHRGVIVEEGPTSQVLHNPQADYTRLLRDAVPRIPDAPAAPAGDGSERGAERRSEREAERRSERGSERGADRGDAP